MPGILCSVSYLVSSSSSSTSLAKQQQRMKKGSSFRSASVAMVLVLRISGRCGWQKEQSNVEEAILRQSRKLKEATAGLLPKAAGLPHLDRPSEFSLIAPSRGLAQSPIFFRTIIKSTIDL